MKLLFYLVYFQRDKNVKFCFIEDGIEQKGITKYIYLIKTRLEYQ